MTPSYVLGFTTLDKEMDIDRLPISGQVPSWLSGVLVRNGPAQFEIGDDSYRHWFDGLAMLHCFRFRNGSISCVGRFLQSLDARESLVRNRITMLTFGTAPRMSFLQRLRQIAKPAFSDNASVHVARIAGKCLALTEVPAVWEFDLHSLETLGPFDYGKDGLPGIVTTAHPLVDAAS